MVDWVDGHPGAARALFIAAIVLLAANFGYGLVHETAHAAVIDALGGHVFGIYVNVFGTDAYTEHTVVQGAAGLVLVNVAGLCATTLMALAFVAVNQGMVAAFLAGRTAIYAFNYSPGSDVCTIHAVAGNISLAFSVIVAFINFACILAVIHGRRTVLSSFREKLTAGLSSSLSRVRPARNS